MKPFNLEEYLKNPERKVVTRDGRKARIICTDRKSHGGYYPIIALVKTDKGEEIVNSYTIDGNWYGGGFKNKLDLFFAPEKHTDYINLYRNEFGYFLGGGEYSTEEEAKRVAARAVDTYITTIKAEWEE